MFYLKRSLCHGASQRPTERQTNLSRSESPGDTPGVDLTMDMKPMDPTTCTLVMFRLQYCHLPSGSRGILRLTWRHVFFRGISFLACVSTLWRKNQRLPASKVNPVAGYESARAWGSRSARVRSGVGIGLTSRPALVAVLCAPGCRNYLGSSCG